MLNVSVAFSLTESSKHLKDDTDLTSHHRFFYSFVAQINCFKQELKFSLTNVTDWL